MPLTTANCCPTPLTKAVNAVRIAQEAHQAVTSHPTRLMTRETLPPLVPFARRRIDDAQVEAGEQPAWPDALEIFFTHLPAAELHVPLDEPGLTRLHAWIQHLQPGQPFRQFALHRNAALRARCTGDLMQAVFSSAVACEVMLADVLAFLLWEDCIKPRDAVTIVNQPFAKKLNAEYSVRLGGDWDQTGTGPVATYVRDLLTLRHRVVHAGHLPDHTEAAKALSAATDLELFIGDRLAQRGRRYPVTAAQYLGEAGLRRRGRFSRFIEQLMHDPTEPPWRTTFMRWRRALDWFVSAEEV
jgi:hypothetical protein